MAKVLVLGPPGSGKTSFVKRSCVPSYEFQDKYMRTHAVEYRQILQKVGEASIEYCLVDTPGNAEWGTHYSAGSLFNGVRVVLCFFDLSSGLSWESFTNRDRFANLNLQFDMNESKYSQINLIVVGAKSDQQSKVSDSNIVEFISTSAPQMDKNPKHTLIIDEKYFKCSAKTGEGVQEIIDYINFLIAKRSKLRNRRDTVVLTGGSANHKNECCT
eukprot:Phypoly_transcript_17504.p1 GENE.Phypoly_transcript_17504~~Phypoly_transcript_17504.p1  ORF type:complete len:215 (+),score=14.17 Phypoly_transcript_17504:68-712(+)